jgi:glyceraldehyde-3-phosphate dehydrogenase (NADP+)
LVDILAFIGTSKAASELQRQHPYPHKLRTVLGLDAKNPAIILPDADLDIAVSECVLGSLSYNGQRCTAIKIIFVHESIKDEFTARFAKAVDSLSIGLPWVQGTSITPLPEPQKPEFLVEIIKDAVSKGANIINPRGGQVDRSIVAPTVLFPVTKEMRIYSEEQFGPVVPIVKYSSLEEVYQFLVDTSYGQQVSDNFYLF